MSFILDLNTHFKNNEQPPSYYYSEEFGRYETWEELEDQILNDNIKVKYLDQSMYWKVWGKGIKENLQYCDQFKYKKFIGVFMGLLKMKIL